MAKRECGNCGVDFKLHTGNEAFCLPCEMLIQAVEPPQHLKDARWAYQGHQPRTPGEKMMSDLMEKNAHNFLERLTRLEDQYREKVVGKLPDKRAAQTWDGKGTCPTCQRGVAGVDKSTEACLQKAEQWLEQRARETERVDA